jgi:hypothetical protein
MHVRGPLGAIGFETLQLSMVDIRPRVALPSLTLAFRSEHRSPSLTALLGVVAQTCPVARSALTRLPRPAAEPDQHQQGRRRAGPPGSSSLD